MAPELTIRPFGLVVEKWIAHRMKESDASQRLLLYTPLSSWRGRLGARLHHSVR
jgi:hypothetical protein